MTHLEGELHGLPPERHPEHTPTSTILANVDEWLEADYSLMSSIHAALDHGTTPQQIRAALEGTALAGEIDRLLEGQQARQKVEQVLIEGGVRLRGPDDQVELFVDVLSLPLRGVSICQTGGGDPSQTPDFEFMREVAESAVPVLYEAGYQLAAIDGSRIVPLNRETAVAELAVSTDDFGVLCGDHSV